MSKSRVADWRPDEPVTVTIADDAVGTLKSLFGGKVPSEASLAAVGWGIAGAKVMVATSPIRPGGIYIETMAGTSTLACMILSRDRSRAIVCELSLVHVDEEIRNPECGVTGTHLFAKQVQALRRLHASMIYATAIGHKEALFIGYYALPRYGFDGRMNDEQFDRLPNSLRRLMGRSRSLTKLFGLPYGPAAWKETGDDIEVSFDLADGSSSMVRLAEYLAKKKGKRR